MKLPAWAVGLYVRNFNFNLCCLVLLMDLLPFFILALDLVGSASKPLPDTFCSKTQILLGRVIRPSSP